MSSELEVTAWRLMNNQYRGVSTSMEQPTRIKDCLSLARHFSIELDHSPIDLGWLEKIARRSGSCWWRIGDESGDGSSGLLLEYWDESDGVILMLPSSGYQPRLRVSTKGQIRTLCRLFGISLKEMA